MSTFNTRCPSCHSLNRVPEERITESPNCGKCQSALLDGAPIEGTEANFPRCCKATNLSSSIFGHHGVTLVSASHRFLVMLPPSVKARSAA